MRRFYVGVGVGVGVGEKYMQLANEKCLLILKFKTEKEG